MPTVEHRRPRRPSGDASRAGGSVSSRTNFENLGVPVKRAGFRGCIVAPDRTGKKDLLYFNFNQIGGRLFLVAVDPDTGETQQWNAPEGPGAWGFLYGPDGKIYLGTWDGGLILRFDPRNPEQGIKVLGRPSETETYIWMFAVGGDGKLYGGTYGNAKLVSYDPKTGEMKDLGRMHETQMYSRTVAAGRDGRIYIGIGTAEADIVVYDPFTGQHRSIAPPDLKAAAKSASTQVGSDGHAYALIADRWFRCEDSKLVPVPRFPGPPDQRLRDGRILQEAGDGYYVLRYPNGETRRVEFRYAGTGSQIFHVGNGPLGRVYGSSVMPLELFEYDPQTNALKDLGNPTPVNGEIYSTAVLDEKLYLCAYPGSWLSVYDPSKPWNYGTSKDSNPRGIGYAGDGHLRPRAMIVGPGKRLFIGSHPPYGEHGGAMAVYDPISESFVENYRNIIPNQSIASLAHDETRQLVFGGSSTVGGGGTIPIEKEARLFAWDPVAKTKVIETVPIAGDTSIRAIVAVDGSIFAASSPSNSLYRYDPDDGRVEVLATLPDAVVDLSLGHRLGMIFGLCGRWVFQVDPAAAKVRMLDQYWESISAGFALNETGIYFGSGVQLVRYRPSWWKAGMPRTREKRRARNAE